MTQRGSHTWDLIQQYHRCPKCGFIIESREDFKYHNTKYSKELKCPRCQNEFTVTKAGPFRLGPLLGQEEHVEVDWEDNK